MFNLTYQERQVILFLITVALVGVGINFLAKRYFPVQSLVSFERNLGKINLNQADKETLISLPGVGEKLAQRIIDYREKNQNFTNSEELKNIKGMSDNRYERLKDLLFVE